MSEKEVRSKAEILIDEIENGTWGMIQVSSQAVEVALAEPPDLAVLLQMLQEMIEKRRKWESPPRKMGPATVSPIRRQELGIVKEAVEQAFHIRLIDEKPGWEWVEEDDATTT